MISGSGDVGTAIETGRGNALRAALESLGIDVDENDARDPAALIEIIKTRQDSARQAGNESPEVDIRAVWKEFLSTRNLPDSDALIERLGLEYECRVNPVWPMPNWRGCLRGLESRTLGVVSNAQFYTPIIMGDLLPGFPEGLGFERQAISYSYEIMQSKPGRDIFEKPLRHLAQRRGITPAETVYIGNDMLNDVWSAGRLGLRTILFAGDQRSLRLREDDERCRYLQPDAVVTDLAQIPALIAGC